MSAEEWWSRVLTTFIEPHNDTSFVFTRCVLISSRHSFHFHLVEGKSTVEMFTIEKIAEETTAEDEGAELGKKEIHFW